MQQIPIKFNISKQEATDVYSFYFEADPHYNFIPGQYSRLDIANIGEVTSRETTRMMSISSAPNDELLRFTMRTDSGSSFKLHMLGLTPGDIIQASPPLGRFTLPDTPTKTLLIGGGIGITPFVSMIRSHPRNELTLVHVAQQHVFQQEISQYPIDQTRISFQLLKKTMATLNIQTYDAVYISGSKRFVDAVKALLATFNIESDKIKLDIFIGY